MQPAPALFCGVALLAHATSALACGATAEPYYVPSQQGPTGNDVALNAPLVVDLSERADGPAEPHLNPRLTLTVEGTDEAPELTRIGSAPRLVWVPQAPLAPSTTYEAHFNPGYEGHPDTIWRFTTGQELTPPVALEGDLEVTFEAGTEPLKECGNNCGTDCRQVGTVGVTKARIRLPRAVLGFPRYHAEVWLTDDAPYDFSRGPRRGLVNLSTWISYDERGQPTEDALFTVPEEEQAYRPCVSVRVVDERGDAAVAPSFCAERVSTFAKGGSGCSFGVARAPSAAGALLLVGLALVTRRRRSRNAP
jgi:MYXO-CTERM domain-containing protein